MIVEFPIDTLSPIRWDEGAWDHLVYDHYKKDMILTFARDHNTSTTKSTDVIAGKGAELNDYCCVLDEDIRADIANSRRGSNILA